MLGCAYCIITSSIIPSMYSKDHTDSLLRNVLEKTWIGHLYSVNKTFFLSHPVAGYNLSSIGAQFMRISNIWTVEESIEYLLLAMFARENDDHDDAFPKGNMIIKGSSDH